MNDDGARFRLGAKFKKIHKIDDYTKCNPVEGDTVFAVKPAVPRHQIRSQHRQTPRHTAALQHRDDRGR